MAAWADRTAELSRLPGSFSSNWAIHRERLVNDLKTKAQMAQGAQGGVDAYRGTDASLTAALEKMTGGG